MTSCVREAKKKKTKMKIFHLRGHPNVLESIWRSGISSRQNKGQKLKCGSKFLQRTIIINTLLSGLSQMARTVISILKDCRNHWYGMQHRHLLNLVLDLLLTTYST